MVPSLAPVDNDMPTKTDSTNIARMTPFDRPIKNVHDLTKVWRFIGGGHGYSAPQSLALLIDAEGLVLPGIVQVYDDHHSSAPDINLVQSLVARLGEALETSAPGGSAAVMRARPGSATKSGVDRRWIAASHQHFSQATYAVWPLFFATDRALGVVPPEDLVAHAS